MTMFSWRIQFIIKVNMKQMTIDFTDYWSNVLMLDKK